MRLYCRCLLHKLTTQWRLTLVALTCVASTLTITLICWSSLSTDITARSKTSIIYNNERLCYSNDINSRHGRSLIEKSATASKSTISIVIVVPSRRNNFMQRRLIRQTYGSIRSVNNVNILAVVFVLGSSDAPTESKTDLDELNTEQIRFGDVIMGDLVDTYRSLSQKSIMAYDWLTSYCREADLVVKTDDDVVVDIFKLTAELGQLPPSAFDSFTFWCSIHYLETIDRNPESMYYVSRDQYASEKFPYHCAGVGYVTTMRLVRRISNEISNAFRGSICSHEDVFLTGIIPEKLNLVGNEPPIEHVNKMVEWVLYVDKYSASESGRYIYKVIYEAAVNNATDFDEFRNLSGTLVFYLFQHDAHFERSFLKLWYLVEKSFRMGEATVTLDIK